jgi:hypothetical protein
VSGAAKRLLGVTVGTVLVCVLVGLYIGLYLTNVPGSASAAQTPTGTQLYLATVPAAALNDPHPTWVSYYSVSPTSTNWRHVTTYDLPAHSLVKITIYQYDSQTGLRNPFISQAEGTVGGNFVLNGKTVNSIDPDTASHVFAIPQMGVSVPLYGISATAKNPCSNAPCSLSQDLAEPGSLHNHLHDPHSGPGPLPLAVLRALCGRIHSGLGRPDADRGVHGRLHQDRMRRRLR